MLVTENTVYKQYIAMNHCLITIDSSLEATEGSKIRKKFEKNIYQSVGSKFPDYVGGQFQIAF